MRPTHDDDGTGRVVHGHGEGWAGPFDIVRYNSDRRWYLEYTNPGAGLPPHRIRVFTAARLADTANLGLPGGKVFDLLWRGVPSL